MEAEQAVVGVHREQEALRVEPGLRLAELHLLEVPAALLGVPVEGALLTRRNAGSSAPTTNGRSRTPSGRCGSASGATQAAAHLPEHAGLCEAQAAGERDRARVLAVRPQPQPPTRDGVRLRGAVEQGLHDAGAQTRPPVRGMHDELARPARDRVGEVEVSEAHQLPPLPGEEVRGVGVAAVAQVQQDVLGQRCGAVDIGRRGDQCLDGGDVVTAQGPAPLQLGHDRTLPVRRPTPDPASRVGLRCGSSSLPSSSGSSTTVGTPNAPRLGRTNL